MTAEPKRSTEFSCFCGIWIFVRLQNCRVVLHVSCEVEITIFLPSGGDGAIFGAQRCNIYICVYICYQRAESDVPRMRYNAAIAEVRTINQQQQTTTTSSSSPFFHQPGCFIQSLDTGTSRTAGQFASLQVVFCHVCGIRTVTRPQWNCHIFALIHCRIPGIPRRLPQ